MSEVTINKCSENAEDSNGIRVVQMTLPEDEGEGLGFRLTRTLWDPYPWVREVTQGSRADEAGLKVGDCLLQVDGGDLLGMPIGRVAGLIRGGGEGRSVTMIAWNCGVDPKDDPELLWSCGGGVNGERSRRALAGVVRALACCVCASTATRALTCKRSHLYCEGCWSRLEKCALCRETLPSKESPYARNLVAEQVFEAIAKEYDLKNITKRPAASMSACTSPNVSPSVTRRGQYQASMMSRRRVQFDEKILRQTYASDPNIHKCVIKNETNNTPAESLGENSSSSNTDEKICFCKNSSRNQNTRCCGENNETVGCCRLPLSCQNILIEHKLLTRLRPACSLADLQQGQESQCCQLSQSLNNLNYDSNGSVRCGSLDNIRSDCSSKCDSSVYILPSPPVYVVTCERKHEN